MRAPAAGAEAVVEVVRDDLDLVVDGCPGPCGVFQGIRVDLGYGGVSGVLYVAEENAFEDRVRRFMVELWAAEGSVTVDGLLCILGGLVICQKDWAVHGLVTGQGLMRDGRWSWLGAAQSEAG